MSKFENTFFSGKTVLITGASSGIGRAFALRAAAHGAKLILVSRRSDTLEQLAASLRAAHHTTVHVARADLSMPGAGRQLFDTIQAQGLNVDILVNNAGVGAHGDLVNEPADKVVSQIQLNVVTLTELTTLLLPEFAARRSGSIINIASTAAFQPIPHMAVYGATKAFVLSFTRALWAETRALGIDVLAVCPGATDTEFFQVAGEEASVGSRRSPDDVVDTTLKALARKHPSVVDGRRNAVVAAIATRLPERVAINVAERSVRPTTH